MYKVCLRFLGFIIGNALVVGFIVIGVLLIEIKKWLSDDGIEKYIIYYLLLLGVSFFVFIIISYFLFNNLI